MATINSGVKITTPGACTIAAGTATGSLSAGVYTYKVTFVTAWGETAAGTASNAITALLNSSMSLTAIPTFSNGNVTARKIYRTSAGGGTYSLAATINDNTTTTYTDTLADASLGATAPTVSTADSLQIVNGWCSFAQPVQVSVQTGITALAGGGQTGATPLTGQACIIATCATLNDSVMLPTINANLIGMGIEVKNNGAANANVFPAVGQTINALAANTAIALASGSSARYRAVTSSNWQSFA